MKFSVASLSLKKIRTAFRGHPLTYNLDSARLIPPEPKSEGRNPCLRSRILSKLHGVKGYELSDAEKPERWPLRRTPSLPSPQGGGILFGYLGE